MKQKNKLHQVGLSLFNYQDDARSNKHKINNVVYDSSTRVSQIRVINDTYPFWLSRTDFYLHILEIFRVR